MRGVRGLIGASHTFAAGRAFNGASPRLRGVIMATVMQLERCPRRRETTDAKRKYAKYARG